MAVLLSPRPIPPRTKHFSINAKSASFLYSVGPRFIISGHLEEYWDIMRMILLKFWPLLAANPSAKPPLMTMPLMR